MPLRVDFSRNSAQCLHLIATFLIVSPQNGHSFVEAFFFAGSRSVAVFIGPHEMGRWQQRERAWALDRLAEHDDFPVVPVLLPGCEPPLGFMKQLTWIDLRDDPTGEAKLDALAAAIVGERVGLDGEPEPRAMVCPYRGLLAFREEDADFYFGRDVYRDKRVELVQRENFVAVVGASGSGKSSLVGAGLIPAMRKQANGFVWDIVRMVPDVDPLYSLAEVLLPLTDPNLSGRTFEKEVQAVARDLEHQEPEAPLWGLVNAVLRQTPGTDRLLLFVDQWEELYTMCKSGPRRVRFIEELLAATKRQESPLTVILTVRADFYGDILQDRPLLDRVENGLINLGPMNADELRSVIEGPAAQVELTFQDGLVDRILREAGDEPGRLALLEFALEGLWKGRDHAELTHAAYEQLGGGQHADSKSIEKTDCLSRAIATYAEDVYGQLSPEEQDVLPRLFRMLVRAGAKTEDDTRRRAMLRDLDETSRCVARKLADRRLLITSRSPVGGADANQEIGRASGSVEVTHEELLRRWVRLQQWVDEDREFQLWRSRIDLKVEELQRDGKTALFRGRPLRESKKFYPSRRSDLDKPQRDFLDASKTAANRRSILIWIGSSTVIAIAAIVWCFVAASTLVDNLVATPSGKVEFYLDRLAPYQIFATSKLKANLADPNEELTHRQRAHAAFGLIRFGEGGAKELTFLLDSIESGDVDSTLPKDEGVNLLNALATMHDRQPLNEELQRRIDQAEERADLSTRNRYLAVASALEITDGASSVCNLKADPYLSRTSFIHGFHEFPGDLARIAQALDQIDDPNLRSALCVAIGTLGPEATDSTSLVLKRLYVNAADGGTHSAAAWALQQQGLTDEDLNQLVTAHKDVSGREWYVNEHGITMLRIPGRMFGIGPSDDFENPTQPFWISDREISVGQFYGMKGDSPQSSEDSHLPMTNISWFDAVEFCNWLSRDEGLKEFYRIDSASINRDESGFITSAIVTGSGHTEGYRLPTERHWEYACRAMSTTDYCYGDATSMLSEYANYNSAAPERCGLRMPNGWGLFDMHGNVDEWCHDELDGGTSRVVRGGSFLNVYPQDLRSALRDWNAPVDRSHYDGFRLSRTP